MSALLLQMVRAFDEQTARKVEALLLPLAEDTIWGTYGKGAMESYVASGVPLPKVRWVRLGDCSTNHLKAIMVNIEEALRVNPSIYVSYHLPHMAAELILADRKAKLCRNMWSSTRPHLHAILQSLRNTCTWFTAPRTPRK